MRLLYADPQQGGAALEYIIVSIFGLVLAISAVAFVGQVAKQKLAAIEAKLGIDFDFETINPFE